MKGLELSRKYYETYGKPALEGEFSHLLPYLAIGLTGSGSECYGYDDEVSADHDFEPGFCIFLPDEATVSRRDAFLLERMYAKLPKEFEGYHRGWMSPVGGNRHGVLRTAEFYTEKTGVPDGNLDVYQWLQIPEYSLAEAINGEIFYDWYGEVTQIRRNLSAYPDDIRRKKLAGYLLLMEQSGQYNYERCLRHGETGAARLAVYEFVKSAMHVIFLLNNVYQPYYKWSFRALRALPLLSDEADILEGIMTAEHAENRIMQICADVRQELIRQGYCPTDSMDLERYAYQVNDTIRDVSIRNLHILSGVE